MKRFKNILFVSQRQPTDLPVLERAVALAFENRARLTVAVTMATPMQWTSPTAPVRMENLLQAALDAERQRYAPILQPLRSHDIAPEFKALPGVPFVEIVREVLTNDRDLVMLGNSSTSRISPRIFGSTLLHLFRKCPCPVWAVRPTPGNRFERILVAVDAIRQEPEARALHVMLLELGSSIAQMDESRLDVMHAWEPPGQAMLRSAFAGVSQADWLAYREEFRVRHEEAFSALLDEVRPSEVETHRHLLEGEAAPSIVRTADELGSDLIVLGTLNTAGLPGFLIGLTAERVLQRVHASVLAVKPPGFVSPIAKPDNP